MGDKHASEHFPLPEDPPKNEGRELMAIRVRVARMFSKYAADQRYKVDEGMKQFAGREEAFLRALVRKFGPEPAAEDVEGLQDDLCDDAAAGSASPKQTHRRGSVRAGSATRERPWHQPAPQAPQRRRQRPEGVSPAPAPPPAAPAPGVGQSPALVAMPAHSASWLAQRDRLERDQVAARDDVDRQQRADFQRFVVSECAHRRASIAQESQRVLTESLAEGREKMHAELARQAQHRAEAEAQTAHDRRLRALLEREGQERVALHELERGELRRLRMAASQSLSVMYKKAVRREREARAMRGDGNFADSQTTDGAAAATTPQREQRLRDAQRMQHDIIAARSERRRQRREEERATAVEARSRMGGLLKDLAAQREARRQRELSKLQRAIASHSADAHHVGAFAPAYLASEVRPHARKPRSNTGRLPPIRPVPAPSRSRSSIN